MPVKALREGWGCPRRPQRTFASSSRGWPEHELQQRRSPAPCCRHSEVRPKGPLLLHGWFVQDFLLDVDRSRRLIEFVTILLLSSVFFGQEACGTLVSQPGIKPTPPALEGKVLTTVPPGKSREGRCF